jgi:hypothetical protein
MPREDEHLQKATHNERFADSLDLSKRCHLEWAITALFYASIHYIEAYFSRYQVHCQDHNERAREISRDPRIRTIFEDYRELQTLSTAARYSAKVFAERDYTLHAKPILQRIKTATGN